MKYLYKSMQRSLCVICAILGIAAALGGCGSRSSSTGPSGANSSAATAPAQTDPHVPAAAIAGEAQFGRQQQAQNQAYAAMMKRQMAQQHKQ